LFCERRDLTTISELRAAVVLFLGSRDALTKYIAQAKQILA
jgi:hypothetical protein